jgi:N-acetylglucosaminyldiphosphoundecaprenol N-acetyl-beta-D-mannosaminyltransferase
MGVDIAAINMEWLVDFTDKNIKELSGDYMCVSNVHTTVTSYEDKDYCAVQNGGIMAIPDGGPLSSVGQKRGYSDMQRTTGPSYMGEIFKISAEHGYRHYFYGSTEETLEKLYKALEREYPGIQIAGMYSPPF